jgi:two-component system response regulator FixJ
MPSEPVIHVIDDDEAARNSLKFLLEAARLAVKTYESAKEFVRALPASSAGCVITDVRMPDMSGIDLLRHLKASGTALPVIVITGHGDIPVAVEAMKIGALDFFEKPYADEALLASVRAALRRHEKDAKHETDKAAIQTRLAALSNRERQVLDGLVAGKANKVIAFDLGISPRTVEIYRANVMTKMEAGSLSELVRMALISGALASTAD